jgi:plastocyanin
MGRIAAAATALIAPWLIGTEAYAADLLAVVKDQRGSMVEGAVVMATPLDRRLEARMKPQPQTVDQVDKEFIPTVTVIYVGSTINFPNNDQIRHQIFSFSPPKKFESRLYAGSAAPPILFDKPGLVVLGCNIHDWMIAYVYVSDTPFFATTMTTGIAKLSGLPPGEYSVRVWQPNMTQAEASTVRPVRLTDEGPTTLEWQLSLKPTYHIPRVSGGLSHGYP